MISFVLTLFSQCEHTGDDSIINEAYPVDAAPELLPHSDQADIGFTDSLSDTGETITPDAAEGQDSLRSRREVYDEFIRAHKDLFAEDTQKIINRRFKEFMETKDALANAKEEIASLNKLLEAKAPCPPDDDFLASHPGFSLEKELENDVFSALYNSGLPFDKVYRAAHSDELALLAAKAAVDNIRARGTRSKESAANFYIGTTLKRDVSRLTKNDRADMARRAMAGEEIKLC